MGAVASRHGGVARRRDRASCCGGSTADDVARPTLQPYGAERLASVLADRAPAYRAADLRLDASGLARCGRRRADLAPWSRCAAAGCSTRRSSDIIRSGRLPDASSWGSTWPRRLPPGSPSSTAACSPSRRSLSRALRTTGCLPVAAGERSKRIRSLERILEWLAAERVERETPLIAVGGGTIGDLAGTAAALYARGLPLVHVPDHLACAGGQRHRRQGGGRPRRGQERGRRLLAAGRSHLATRGPPLASAAAAARRDGGVDQGGDHRRPGSSGCCSSSAARRRCAADEAARYAILERSARLKLGVCERDPFETGERRTLNLGHTIGHALEIESGYRLPHGAAVALGMRSVAAIAAARGADPELASAPRRPAGSAGIRAAALVRRRCRARRIAGRQEAARRTPALDPADGDRPRGRGR